MSEGRQTVAGAFAKIEGHEEVCAERYRRLDELISGLAGSIKDQAAETSSQIEKLGQATREQVGDVKSGVKWLIGLVCTVASVLILGLGSVTWGYISRDLAKAHEQAVQQATGD